ncbi:MAG: HD domain-containing protein [bacterium]|nr:HD domain-containing protein [bacterium]
MQTRVEQSQPRNISSGYIPIYTHTLTVDCVLEFDLYVFDGRDMVLFRSSKLPLTEAHRSEMLRRNLSRLYVSEAQRSEYQKHLREHISQIVVDPSLDDFTKTTILYDSARELVKDVFADPTKGAMIRESQEFVQTTVQYVLEGKNAFHNLLKVMSFDYTVFSHSVNVCAFSLALGNASGIEKTSDLVALATGALLHDVGKARVPEEILHKPGPLSQAEWQTIRQHPEWGVELMTTTDLIPREAYIPIAQHHERQDGSGYPNRLGGDGIHLYGKVVAIADSFDAMTTNRVYRQAEGSFRTLEMMAHSGEEFDRSLLRQFIQLLGPSRTELLGS